MKTFHNNPKTPAEILERLTNVIFYRLFTFLFLAAIFGAVYCDAWHQLFIALFCAIVALVLKIELRKTR